MGGNSAISNYAINGVSFIQSSNYYFDELEDVGASFLLSSST
jgi:hypothetical protein